MSACRVSQGDDPIEIEGKALRKLAHKIDPASNIIEGSRPAAALDLAIPSSGRAY